MMTRPVDVLLALTFLGCLAVALGTALSFQGHQHAVLEIFTHFRMHYVAATFVAVCIFAALRRPGLLAFAVLIFAVNLLDTAPLLFGRIDGGAVSAESGGVPSQRRHWKLLSLNVLQPNQRYDAVIALLRRENPDVVTLQEIDDGWFAALEPTLRDLYPHRIEQIRGDRFGIGLFSKFPLRRAELVYYGLYRVGIPAIHAEVDTGVRIVEVMAAHPPPPMAPVAAEARNDSVRELLLRARHSDAPLILAGDLNNTPWSPDFRNWVRESRLEYPYGMGWLPTWHSGGILRKIPIDHCLASKEARIVSRRTGPFVGSDHLPLICEVEF